MFRFISNIGKEELNKRYLDIFKQPRSRSRKFTKLLNDYPEIKDIIPAGYQTVDKILTAPFDILAKIYYGYVDMLESKGDEAKTINAAVKIVFNYDSYKTKIGQFIISPDNGFPVHNCIYCDMTKVSGYVESKTGKRIREFETEHILDKGNCPLVSLSLYNFVPSCGTCNGQDNKGTKTLGRTIEETILLSPTTPLNKFAEEVTFSVLPSTEEIKDLIMFRSDNDLQIVFKGETEKYERTINMFALIDRYNQNKGSVFGILENMRTWNLDMGRSYPIHPEDNDRIFESMFGFKRRARAFEPMEKCRRDIFEEHFGKIPE